MKKCVIGVYAPGETKGQGIRYFCKQLHKIQRRYLILLGDLNASVANVRVPNVVGNYNEFCIKVRDVAFFNVLGKTTNTFFRIKKLTNLLGMHGQMDYAVWAIRLCCC